MGNVGVTKSSKLGKFLEILDYVRMGGAAALALLPLPLQPIVSIALQTVDNAAETMERQAEAEALDLDALIAKLDAEFPQVLEASRRLREEIENDPRP